MADAPILQGNLIAFSIADIMTLLNMIRKSGVLFCKQLTIEKAIHWSNGDVVFATSNLPEDGLGEFLVARGRLSRAQLEQASSRVTADVRLGKVLVRDALLSPRDLWWAVQTQVLEIVYSIFQWDSGVFVLRDEEQTEIEKIQLSSSTQNIIMEGIRRLDEWGRIRERIPDPSLVPVLRLPAQEIAKRVELRQADQKILPLIDGRRTVRSITKESGLGGFESQLALLGLMSAGYVELEAQRSEGRSMASFLGIDDDPILLKQIAHFNKLYSDLFHALREKLGDETLQRIQALLVEPKYDAADVVKGLRVDTRGCLNEAEVLANIADLPLDERARNLVCALSNHLQAQFQEFGSYLDPAYRAQLYRTVHDYTQRWRA